MPDLTVLDPNPSPAPEIDITPVIDVGIVMNDNLLTGEHKYFCDFTPAVSGLLYDVKWTLTTKIASGLPVHHSSYQLFDQHFREATALTEAHLKNKEVYKLGFTVHVTLLKA